MTYDQIGNYRHAHYHPGRPLDNASGQQFPNQKLTPEQRMVAYQRWQGGEDLRALAEEYGCSFGRMRGICYHLKRVDMLKAQGGEA